MYRTKDIINHECLSRKERSMAGLSGINHLRQGRAAGFGERSVERSTEEAWEALVEERKRKGLGKNKIKEENRWQFFTSFLKRGLGTRGASLNRFFQRGERAHFSAVFLCQTAQTVPTSSCFVAEHGCRSKAEFRLESEISIPRSAIPLFSPIEQILAKFRGRRSGASAWAKNKSGCDIRMEISCRKRSGCEDLCFGRSDSIFTIFTDWDS